VSAAPPLVSVVVLSYDRPTYLRQALASLVAQSVTDREIVVVDNRSASSAEVARVVAAFPEARLHAFPANLGFTGGMNGGIALATGRYVLLTEDDIVLEPGCLEALLSDARGRERGGVVTGMMLDADTGRVRAAGGEVDLGPPYRLAIVGEGHDPRDLPERPYSVSFASGAFLFLDRRALEALGGFRGDYFMYGEDVELCLRARRLGLEIRVVPSARFAHLPPRAAAASPAVKYHMVKNLLATYTLYAPLGVLPLAGWRYGPKEALRRLASGAVEFVPFVRAWVWWLLHAPALLLQRRATRP
jgi:N-acetylglucosaminyl-diphospho-decaprenol L-rhamnosyltransferase